MTPSATATRLLAAIDDGRRGIVSQNQRSAFSQAVEWLDAKGLFAGDLPSAADLLEAIDDGRRGLVSQDQRSVFSQAVEWLDAKGLLADPA